LLEGENITTLVADDPLFRNLLCSLLKHSRGEFDCFSSPRVRSDEAWQDDGCRLGRAKGEAGRGWAEGRA